MVVVPPVAARDGVVAGTSRFDVGSPHRIQQSPRGGIPALDAEILRVGTSGNGLGRAAHPAPAART